ncbi:hypothetical protein M3Y99_00276700 [Aphelenchoides fujianensis]|nr:hypothetical protein M3Y99_00276700 [Aphelenchoides fujianensis]
MRSSRLLSFFSLSLLVHCVLPCARTNPGGGGTGTVTTTVPTITTTTAAMNCQEMTGSALLAGDFTVDSTLWGDVQPTDSCSTCAASPTANYYPDSGIDVPAAMNEKAIGGVTCMNLCVCSPDGTCFTRTTDNVNVVLYPFCNAGTCAVYAVVVAQDDTQGITDGTTTITAAQQIDPATLDRLPITSGQYPEVSYASCSGCTTQTTC